eukprot:scaffold14.g1257.t1
MEPESAASLAGRLQEAVAREGREQEQLRQQLQQQVQLAEERVTALHAERERSDNLLQRLLATERAADTAQAEAERRVEELRGLLHRQEEAAAAAAAQRTEQERTLRLQVQELEAKSAAHAAELSAATDRHEQQLRAAAQEVEARRRRCSELEAQCIGLRQVADARAQELHKEKHTTKAVAAQYNSMKNAYKRLKQEVGSGGTGGGRGTAARPRPGDHQQHAHEQEGGEPSGSADVVGEAQMLDGDDAGLLSSLEELLPPLEGASGQEGFSGQADARGQAGTGEQAGAGSSERTSTRPASTDRQPRPQPAARLTLQEQLEQEQQELGTPPAAYQQDSQETTTSPPLWQPWGHPAGIAGPAAEPAAEACAGASRRLSTQEEDPASQPAGESPPRLTCPTGRAAAAAAPVELAADAAAALPQATGAAPPPHECWDSQETRATPPGGQPLLSQETVASVPSASRAGGRQVLQQLAQVAPDGRMGGSGGSAGAPPALGKRSRAGEPVDQPQQEQACTKMPPPAKRTQQQRGRPTPQPAAGTLPEQPPRDDGWQAPQLQQVQRAEQVQARQQPPQRSDWKAKRRTGHGGTHPGSRPGGHDGFDFDDFGGTVMAVGQPTAQPAVPALRQHQDRQQLQQAAPHQPASHPPPGGYKYQEVVRKRAEREALTGFACQECARFYQAVATWGQAAAEQAGAPRCQHGAATGGAPGSGGAAIQDELRQAGSRHRYRYEPPSTPGGYWDFDITQRPPQSAAERGCEEAAAVPAPVRSRWPAPRDGRL